ncbi:hypothetical protein DEFFOIHO_00255 [Enterobacteria phage Cognac]|nr:hypothetical protein DEFFOIHO_00255 [Enterobacteria phage Cognac]
MKEYPEGGYIAFVYKNKKIVPLVVETLEESNRITSESLRKLAEMTNTPEHRATIDYWMKELSEGVKHD